MKIGNYSGSSVICDFISRSGVLSNQTRARIQPQQRTARVNDTGQKERSGTSTDKGRAPMRTPDKTVPR